MNTSHRRPPISALAGMPGPPLRSLSVGPPLPQTVLIDTILDDLSTPRCTATSALVKASVFTAYQCHTADFRIAVANDPLSASLETHRVLLSCKLARETSAVPLPMRNLISLCGF